MPPSERSDDELDRLLGRARWPQPNDEQVARLGDRWRRMRTARRRRQIALVGLSVAASVLLVVGVLRWRTVALMPRTILSIDVRSPAEESRPDESRPESDEPVLPPGPPAPWAIVPRDPNAYERVALVHMFAERAPRSPDVDERLIEEWIAALAKDPDADVAKRLERLGDDLAAYERRLADAARAGPPTRRLGAARLLARVGTRRSAPVFAELAADPVTREAAILGLARLGSDRNLAELASVEHDAALRKRLLGMLLERKTPQAVALYLGFVAAPTVRDEALDALEQMDDPPADPLLAFLENPQSSLRLAAALALSRISDPAVIERLCESIAGIGRQEALIALLLSQSEQAAGCLNRARRDLYLVASLQAAEHRLHSLQISSGGNLP